MILLLYNYKYGVSVEFVVTQEFAVTQVLVVTHLQYIFIYSKWKVPVLHSK